MEVCVVYNYIDIPTNAQEPTHVFEKLFFHVREPFASHACALASLIAH